MATSRFIYPLVIIGAASSVSAVRTMSQNDVDLMAQLYGLDGKNSMGFTANDSVLLSENPCAITEDLTPAQWQEKFLSEFQSGQAVWPVVTHTAVIRIGTMGSGKSSAVDSFLEDKYGWQPSQFQIVDLDRIVTSSAAYRSEVCSGTTMKTLSMKEMGDAWWAGQVNTSGYGTVSSIIEDVSSRGLTFSIEQTGKFMCPLKRVCRQLYKKGYKVIGVSPYVPYYVLKGRVAKRSLEEGRAASTEALESNMKMFLPVLFDMVFETDEFYILNNDVPFGHPAEVLVSSEIDWTQRDSQKCSSRAINKSAVEALRDKVKSASSMYTTDSERDIHAKEVKFLQKLYEAAESGNPCEWA